MNKKNTKTIIDEPIVLNTSNVQSSYICPNCGEKHHIYIFLQGKQKVIDVGYCFKAAFLKESYDYKRYHCLTCGYKWEIRKYI